MSSRKNAMLTTEDRKWLTGEKTYEGQHAKQQRYQRRRDIRERIYNSILDFSIVFEELDIEEHREIFGDVSDDGRQWMNDDADLRDGVRDGLAFLFYTVGVAALMRDDSGPTATVPEWMIKSGLQRAGQKDGLLVEDAQLDVEATDVAVPNLLDALESGEDISPAGLYHLMESSVLDADVVQECLREQFDAQRNDEGGV